MAEISEANGNHGMVVNIIAHDDDHHAPDLEASQSNIKEVSNSRSCLVTHLPLTRKLIAEALGTYFLIFGGCGAVVVNADQDKVVTLPGIAMVWGFIVMVMIFATGHVSGAHFNPAVTIAYATCNRFPWKHVPAYILTQVTASTLASGTLRLLYRGRHYYFFGTLPTGTDLQSLVLEFIITFFFMFVMAGVATDKRAVGEVAGLAIGATVLVNVLYAGPISGASMNPARTIGPAIVSRQYEGLWIYLLGPISGAVAGAWAYNLVRSTDKHAHDEITKKGSFLKNLRQK